LNLRRRKGPIKPDERRSFNVAAAPVFAARPLNCASLRAILMRLSPIPARVATLIAGLFLATAAATPTFAQAGLAPNESPLRAPQEAILRGERAAARAMLDRLIASWNGDDATLADAALLRAAAAPAPERAAAFVAVAEAFSDRPIADVALVAALASIATPNAFEGPLLPAPESEGPPPETSEFSDRRQLVGRVAALLKRREEAPNADKAALDEARARFAALAANAWSVDDARVRPGGSLPLPSGLAEPARFAVRAIVDAFGEGPTALGPPLIELLVDPARKTPPIATPPPGAYVLEATSLDGVRRVRRRLFVSGLDLSVVDFERGVVVAALLDGAPKAGVVATLRYDGADATDARPPFAATTDANGIAYLPRTGAPTSVRASFGAHIAEAKIHLRPTAPRSTPIVPRAHVVVDRRSYARGDRVFGRVVVRDVLPSPPPEISGSESRPFLFATPAPTPLRVALFPYVERESAVEGTTDANGVFAFELPIAPGAPLGPARLVVADLAGAPGRGRILFDDAILDVLEPGPIDAFVTATAPRSWRPGDPPPTISVSVAQDAFGPRPGDATRASVQIGLFGAPTSAGQTEPLASDGSLQARIGIDALDAAAFARARAAAKDARRLDFTVETRSDGALGASSPKVAGRIELPADDEPSSRPVLEATFDSGAPRTQRPCVVSLRGPASAVVLVAFGGADLLHATTARLDEQGRATIPWTPSLQAWPTCRVVATIVGAADEVPPYQALVDVARDDAPPVLTLVDDARSPPRPGHKTDLRLRVTRRGRPLPRVATVAIAPEAAVARDEPLASTDLNLAMRPPFLARAAATSAGAPPDMEPDVFERLADARFTDAPIARRPRAPRPTESARPRPETEGPRVATNAPLRAPPTVFFEPSLPISESGDLVVPFDPPADGRAYVIRAWVVCDDGATATFETRRLAPIFGRIDAPPHLFEGDVVKVRLLLAERVDQDALPFVEGSGPLTVEDVSFDSTTDIGAVFVATVRAAHMNVRADEGLLKLFARAGDDIVLATAKIRVFEASPPYVAEATTFLSGDAPARLRAPERRPTGTTKATVRVFEGRDAAARAARLSIPENHFRDAERSAAIIAASAFDAPSADGSVSAAVGEAFAFLSDARTPHGYRRSAIRDYFRVLKAHRGATIAAIEALAFARERGVDIGRYDAAPDLRAGIFAAAIEALRTAGGDPDSALSGALFRGLGDTTEDGRRASEDFFANTPKEERREALIDVVAASLRLRPDHSDAKEALTAFAKRGVVAGGPVLTRVAIALAKAGDIASAASIAARVPAAAFAPQPNAFDDATTFAAERLLLATALGLPEGEFDARRRALAEALVDAPFTPPRAAALVLIAHGGAVDHAETAGVGEASLREGGRVVSGEGSSFGRSGALFAVSDVDALEFVASDGRPRVAIVRVEGREAPATTSDDIRIDRVVKPAGPRSIEIAMSSTTTGDDMLLYALSSPAASFPSRIDRAPFRGEWGTPIYITFPTETSAAYEGSFLVPPARVVSMRDPRVDVRSTSFVWNVESAKPPSAGSGLSQFGGWAEKSEIEARMAVDRLASLADDALIAGLAELRRIPSPEVERRCAALLLPRAARGELSALAAREVFRTAGTAADVWFEGAKLSDAATAPNASPGAIDILLEVRPLPASKAAREAFLKAALAPPSPSTSSLLGPVEREIAILESLARPAEVGTLLERVAALDAALDAPSSTIATQKRDRARLDLWFEGVARVLDAEAPTEERAPALARVVASMAARIATEDDPELVARVADRGAACLAWRTAAPSPTLEIPLERWRDAVADAVIRTGAPAEDVAWTVLRGDRGGRLSRAARLLEALATRARTAPGSTGRAAATGAVRAVLSAMREEVEAADAPYPILLRLLVDDEGAPVRDAAYWALSKTARLEAPSAVLVKVVRERPEALDAESLATRRDGPELLRAVIAEAADVRAVDAAVRALRFGARPLQDVPTVAIAKVARALSADAADLVSAELAARALESPDALASLLAASDDPQVRDALTDALGSAGFIDVPWRQDDPRAARDADVLATRIGDSAAADRLRARIKAATSGGRRSQGAADDAEALLDALIPALTPLDVVRLGAPRRSPALLRRVASWTDDSWRAALAPPPPTAVGGSAPSNSEPATRPGAPIDAASAVGAVEAAEEERGSETSLLALAPVGRLDALRPELVAWFRRLKASPDAGAADILTAFSRLGSAQLDLLAETLVDPPTSARERERGDAALPVARVRVIEALDRRPAIIEAAAAIVESHSDESARLAFAKARLLTTGHSSRVRKDDDSFVLIEPRTPEETDAALSARLRVEGLAALQNLPPPLRAAWSRALQIRGLTLR
jgi:hypothetical protein